MINDKHKFIFVHINKCAGTSIKKTLLKYQEHNFDIDGRVDGISRPLRGHVRLEMYPQNKIDNYFTFAFVRNPWERLVSQYFFNGPGTGRVRMFPKIDSEKEISFKEYIMKYFNNDVQISIGQPPQMLPWLTDSNGRFIDFVGRFENLQNDFNIVCNNIGIDREKLPHIQKTNHHHYTDYYDDESREVVAEKFKGDIEYFKYKFGD